MVLFSHSSYKQGSAEQSGKEKMPHIVKKDLWINEKGDIKEGSGNDLPKGWNKGKLIAIAGTELSDLQAKEYGLGKETKAKTPKENKSK